MRNIPKQSEDRSIGESSNGQGNVLGATDPVVNAPDSPLPDDLLAPLADRLANLFHRMSSDFGLLRLYAHDLQKDLSPEDTSDALGEIALRLGAVSLGLESMRTQLSETIKHGTGARLAAPTQEIGSERAEMDDANQIADVVTNGIHGIRGALAIVGATLHNTGLEHPELSERRQFEAMRRLLARIDSYLSQMRRAVEGGEALLSEVNAAVVLREVEATLRPQLPANVNLHLPIAPNSQEVLVCAEPDQLALVLVELVRNATQAIGETEGNVYLDLRSTDEEVYISVRDDAQGIPVKLRSRVFRDVLPTGKGRGSGLLLSGKVVGQMGGKIEVERTGRHGTVMTVTLRRRRAESKQPC